MQLFFLAWLLSLSMMLLRFTHGVALGLEIGTPEMSLINWVTSGKLQNLSVPQRGNNK